MVEPQASRPYMPGYGVLPPEEGTGLLPWSWARERLAASHDYWVSTVRPDGRPHAMPVWGVWLDACLWFSSSLGSRKARNIAGRADCVVTTDDALNPVVVEGRAEVVADRAGIAAFLDALNGKYETSYGIDFLDPDVNGTFRVRPVQVFGLREGDFTGSPTRWRFTSAGPAT
ncbi:pyridoxamine 5'-phosphate oxidase family protein [Yinghuangia seranimata]|uniref:pyridoxamine 5'-phosphate oxidase family protein n=1 Tax=Yinghuangia seranimata TaxID=408067 RepID=UPI00248B5BFE|nr:pyridoxamine 5'-phosphate oxidase family protein [Yinghuangia seranimata]MDI2130380.1 pyridoxamine 5'-phosphate oxidase family protein [Yinghuangia seranimata]